MCSILNGASKWNGPRLSASSPGQSCCIHGGTPGGIWFLPPAQSRCENSNFLKERLPPFPGFIVSFLVGRIFVGRVLARSHEAMACAFIGHRLVRFACFLHLFGGFGN